MTNPWIITQRQKDEATYLALQGKVNGLMIRLNPAFPTGEITEDIETQYQEAVTEKNNFVDYMNSTYNLNLV